MQLSSQPTSCSRLSNHAQRHADIDAKPSWMLRSHVCIIPAHGVSADHSACAAVASKIVPSILLCKTVIQLHVENSLLSFSKGQCKICIELHVRAGCVLCKALFFALQGAANAVAQRLEPFVPASLQPFMRPQRSIDEVTNSFTALVFIMMLCTCVLAGYAIHRAASASLRLTWGTFSSLLLVSMAVV